jgi:hypothetical protein
MLTREAKVSPFFSVSDLVSFGSQLPFATPEVTWPQGPSKDFFLLCVSGTVSHMLNPIGIWVIQCR